METALSRDLSTGPRAGFCFSERQGRGGPRAPRVLGAVPRGSRLPRKQPEKLTRCPLNAHAGKREGTGPPRGASALRLTPGCWETGVTPSARGDTREAGSGSLAPGSRAPLLDSRSISIDFHLSLCLQRRGSKGRLFTQCPFTVFV